MPPCSSSKLTSCSAASPAKVLVRRSTLRSGGGMLTPPATVLAVQSPAELPVSRARRAPAAAAAAPPPAAGDGADQPPQQPDDAPPLEEDDQDTPRARDPKV